VERIEIAAALSAISAFLLCTHIAAARSQPARNGLIAYASDSHSPELFTMDGTGRSLRRLTVDRAPSRWPALSPDGSRVAFSRKSHGLWRVFVMNLDGSGLRDIAVESNQLLGFDGYPDWSPDGNELAFSATQGDGRQDIIAYDLDARTTRDITPDLALDSRPRWSPNGKQIVYASNGTTGDLDIYVVNSDGTGKRQITTAPDWQFEPSWSPDGTQIVYTAYPDPTT